MKLKGIIDCDFTNYKEPVLTLEFPRCNFKCDKLNGCKVCQNSALTQEPDIDIPIEKIWLMYEQNPLTKGFCCQGLEPFDSDFELLDFIETIRYYCDDPIIIYTGYSKSEIGPIYLLTLKQYPNIIIKWGRYVLGYEPHYDKVLGVNLASNNQYAEVMS